MSAFVPTTNGKNVLLIIDPQVDFHPGGSLGINGQPIFITSFLSIHTLIIVFFWYVGANEDSQRISDLIRTHVNELDEIYVTLDSHHVCLMRNKHWCIDIWPVKCFLYREIILHMLFSGRIRAVKNLLNSVRSPTSKS